MTTLRQRLSIIEQAVPGPEPQRCRVFYGNADGLTATDIETGEVVALADHPDMIVLTWGDHDDN